MKCRPKVPVECISKRFFYCTSSHFPHCPSFTYVHSPCCELSGTCPLSQHFKILEERHINGELFKMLTFSCFTVNITTVFQISPVGGELQTHHVEPCKLRTITLGGSTHQMHASGCRLAVCTAVQGNPVFP